MDCGMEGKTTAICRLCLEVATEGKSEIIDAEKMNMIRTILPEKDLNLDSNSKMCKTCSNTISAWTEFRHNFIRKTQNMEYDVCYFCKIIFECLQLEDASHKILDKCFIDTKAVVEQSNFKSCSQCRHLLEDFHKFIITYTNSTQKIKEYCCTLNVTPQDVNLFEVYRFSHGSSISTDGKSNLASTIKLEDKKDEFERGREKMFRCKECTYETRHRSHLKIHLLIHKNITEVEAFKCRECPYKTKHKENLKNHKLKHKNYTSTEMHKCKHCIFMTKYVHSYRKHVLIHKKAREVKKYRCTQCTYETKRKHNLKKHLLTHRKQCLPETKYEAPLVNQIMVPVVAPSFYCWMGNSYYLLPMLSYNQ